VTRSGGFIDPRALTGQTSPRIYYPAAQDVDRATAVIADAGARIYGIDFQLVSVAAIGRH
jgi:hypothetical protein